MGDSAVWGVNRGKKNRFGITVFFTRALKNALHAEQVSLFFVSSLLYLLIDTFFTALSK
jgi:hypothetical protein